MQVSSAKLIILLLVVSFILQSSALPLPQQHAVIANEPVPLEADDDPARLRRYQSYGLKQTKVQRAQSSLSAHPDAAPSITTPGMAQMTTNPTGAAQENVSLGGAYVQPAGEIRTLQTGNTPIGEEETSRSQRGGTVGPALLDQSDTQAENIQVGQDVSNNAGVIRAGEAAISAFSGTPQTSPQTGGYPSAGGMTLSSGDGPAVPEVTDPAASGSVIGSPQDPSGVASLTPGAGTASLGSVGTVREAVPEFAQGSAQMLDANVGSMAGQRVAQSKAFNGKETSSLQFGQRYDNGIPTLPQRPAVPAATSDSAAHGLYVAQ